MKKSKGFTLIELLAVIVILAVIALIAVPRIIEILNKSRLSAAEDSTMGIVEAAESYVASFMLQNHGAIPSENLVFECSSEGCLITTNLEGYDKTNLEKLNYKGKNASSGNITISNSGKSIQATNLNINGFTCNYLNDEAYCGKKEYNSGDPYELGGYDWHVISDDGKYLTLLMDAGQLENMNHCTNDTKEDTDCGVSYDGSYYQYSWDKSIIRSYLNDDKNEDGFLKKLENSIEPNKLVETEICPDGSSGTSGVFSYGGYLRGEIESIEGAKCNSEYVTDKVRLITLSEYNALSPTYKNSPFLLDNGGKLATKTNITRVNDSNSSWLYSNSIDVWLTMGANSYSDAGNVRYVHEVGINGYLSLYYGHYARVVRPIVTIRK